MSDHGKEAENKGESFWAPDTKECPARSRPPTCTFYETETKFYLNKDTLISGVVVGATNKALEGLCFLLEPNSRPV